MTRQNKGMLKGAVATTFAVGMVGFVGIGTAGASHTHSMRTGNGSCVLLAQDGGEKDVELPFAEGPSNRLHPLHVLVHLGEPGAGGHITIGVAGSASDPCPGDYLND